MSLSKVLALLALILAFIGAIGVLSAYPWVMWLGLGLVALAVLLAP